MELTQSSVLVVAAVAVLAPILADLTPRVRVPIVVAEVMLGVIVGPEVLDLATPDAFLEALSTFGLAFLFFLAGLEIDFAEIEGRPAKLAVGGWGSRWPWAWASRWRSGPPVRSTPRSSWAWR